MRSLVDRDLEVIWHPATHFCDLQALPPLPIASARGVWLHTTDGRRILDAISSWWTCLHGHGHPRIVAAVREQIERLDHVMLAGFTHEAAVSLAEALLSAAPAGYGKVFYADSGSAAVEVALKMSYQSRLQTGASRRRRFAALDNSYHGETLGALAVCGSDAYRSTFAPLLMDVLYLPVATFEHHATEDLGGDLGADSPEADEAVARLRAHADELTALVVEPLVQCAGRMSMMGTGFYRRLVREAQALGIHVIADEIAVAFGRTGRLFASSWADVSPDFVCLSKGLSGGILPLSCVLVRAGLEDAFAEDPSKTFLHSHTYTGNPIACAAGLASLQLLHDVALPGLPPRIEAMSRLRHAVARRCPAVVAHRQAGMIAAFRVAPRDGGPAPADGRLGLALRQAALRHDVHLRPLHDTVYWMPPLCIDVEEIELLADATCRTIEEVLT